VNKDLDAGQGIASEILEALQTAFRVVDEF
jgi:hypothetical protein